MRKVVVEVAASVRNDGTPVAAHVRTILTADQPAATTMGPPGGGAAHANADPFATPRPTVTAMRLDGPVTYPLPNDADVFEECLSPGGCDLDHHDLPMEYGDGHVTVHPVAPQSGMVAIETRLGIVETCTDDWCGDHDKVCILCGVTSACVDGYCLDCRYDS